MLTALHEKELKPLRDKIAGAIRDAIIEGRVKPGERLAEPDVAKTLGVSRTPLREAFFQLESEGFVVVTPRKGAVVSELSEKDANETYTIKGTLEALAAELACGNLTEELLKELSELNERMEKAVDGQRQDMKKFLQLNSRFHQLIYDACGNEKLSKLIATLRQQTLRYNYVYISRLSHPEESVKEHAAIIKAFKKRDRAAAYELTKKHSENARQAICTFIRHN